MVTDHCLSLYRHGLDDGYYDVDNGKAEHQQICILVFIPDVSGDYSFWCSCVGPYRMEGDVFERL